MPVLPQPTPMRASRRGPLHGLPDSNTRSLEGARLQPADLNGERLGWSISMSRTGHFQMSGVIDVNTGMIAAARLQALIESRASGTRIADLMAQMGRIIDAIHSSVPEELWP